jgi:transketolase
MIDLPRHNSIRGEFAYQLHRQMEANKDIYLIFADLGFAMLDYCRRDFPDRCINTGAAEASAVGIATGLALSERIPFVYTITSFYLRAAETIALYQAGEGIPVHLVGSGMDDDYKHDGPSHHGGNAQAVLRALGINSLYPETKEEIPDIVEMLVKSDKPNFLCLRR